MTQTDRRFGVAEGLAVKAPVRCATTANITLSGLQTIDGITVVADDRVLVKNQTTTTQNGIYIASSGDWTRAPDFDGSNDIVKGTRVWVNDGTENTQTEYYVSTSNPIVIDTSSITFIGTVGSTPTVAEVATIAALRLLSTSTEASSVLVYTYHSGGTKGGGTFRYDASDTTSSDDSGMVIVDASSRRWKRVIAPYNGICAEWFGAKFDDSNDDYAAIQAAVDYVEAQIALGLPGGTVILPIGAGRISAAITIENVGGVHIRGQGKRSTSLAITSQTDAIYFSGGGTNRIGSGLTGVQIYKQGAEHQASLAYDGQTGNFTVGQIVTGGTSGAVGTIVSDTDSGTSGTLVLSKVFGVFQDNEALTDPLGGAALVNGTITHRAGLRLVNQSDFTCTDVEFRGLDVGVWYESTNRSFFTRCSFRATGRTNVGTACFYVTRTSGSASGGGLHITDAEYITGVNALSNTEAPDFGPGFGHEHFVYVTSLEILTIQNSHWNGVNNGITLDPQGGSLDEIANVQVTNTYFDGNARAVGAGIKFNGAVGSGKFYKDIWLVNCYLRTGKHGIHFSVDAGQSVSQVHVIGGEIANMDKSGIYCEDDADCAVDVNIYKPFFRDCNQADDTSHGDIVFSGERWNIENCKHTDGSYHVSSNPSPFAIKARSSASNSRVRNNDASNFGTCLSPQSLFLNEGVTNDFVDNLAPLNASLDYDTQTANFTVGQLVTGDDSGATGVIVQDEDGGASGTLHLSGVFGTFQNNELLTDPLGGSALVNGTATSAFRTRTIRSRFNFTSTGNTPKVRPEWSYSIAAKELVELTYKYRMVHASMTSANSVEKYAAFRRDNSGSAGILGNEEFIRRQEDRGNATLVAGLSTNTLQLTSTGPSGSNIYTWHVEVEAVITTMP